MSSSPAAESKPNFFTRDPNLPTKVYSGGCHCGKFTFECRHPVLEDGFKVVSCNCSICSQRGYLFIYILDPKTDFKMTNGAFEDLTRYKFNRNIVGHAFCPVCGCGIFEEVHPEAIIIGVNVRAITGIDLDSLRLTKHNGRDEHNERDKH